MRHDEIRVFGHVPPAKSVSLINLLHTRKCQSGTAPALSSPGFAVSNPTQADPLAGNEEKVSTSPRVPPRQDKTARHMILALTNNYISNGSRSINATPLRPSSLSDGETLVSALRRQALTPCDSGHDANVRPLLWNNGHIRCPTHPTGLS